MKTSSSSFKRGFIIVQWINHFQVLLKRLIFKICTEKGTRTEVLYF